MDRVRGWKWYAVPLLIFVVTRLVDVVLILVVAAHQLPASTFPSTLVAPIIVDPPTYFHVIASWDGQWYRIIVEHGYPSHLPMLHGAVNQNPWAYYPLYPGLIRLVMLTGLPFGAAASVVSLVCGALAMCLLYRLLVPRAGRFVAAITVLALCTYPAAVTFQLAYAESLALLLVLAGLWCLRHRRYGLLVAAALLLALTRPIVLPLALVAAVHWLGRWRGRATDPFPRREAITLAAITVAIAASFLLWPAMAAIHTGRLDAYFVTEQAWLPPGQTGWPSWVTVLGGGSKIVVAWLALVLLCALVLRPSAAMWGLELRSWAMFYPLDVLASTRPTPSVFRYVMLATVLWWPFPEVGKAVTTTRERVALAVAIATMGFASQFAWLSYEFVVTGALRGWP